MSNFQNHSQVDNTLDRLLDATYGHPHQDCQKIIANPDQRIGGERKIDVRSAVFKRIEQDQLYDQKNKWLSFVIRKLQMLSLPLNSAKYANAYAGIIGFLTLGVLVGGLISEVRIQKKYQRHIAETQTYEVMTALLSTDLVDPWPDDLMAP